MGEEAKQLANKKMLDLNEAYGTLKDEEKRKKYDIGGIDGPNMGDFNFSNGTSGGPSGFNGENVRFTTSGMNGQDASHIFNMFFSEGSNNHFNFGNKSSKKGNSSFGGAKDPFGGFG